MNRIKKIQIEDRTKYVYILYVGKPKITKRMASSITTTTSNPINKKYLEY